MDLFGLGIEPCSQQKRQLHLLIESTRFGGIVVIRTSKLYNYVYMSLVLIFIVSSTTRVSLNADIRLLYGIEKIS